MGLDKFQKTPCGFCFVEYYTHHNETARQTLLETDPELYELVKRVMPAHRATGNVYGAGARLPW